MFHIRDRYLYDRRPLLLQKNDMERIEDKVIGIERRLELIDKNEEKKPKQGKRYVTISDVSEEIEDIEKILDKITGIERIDVDSVRPVDYELKEANEFRIAMDETLAWTGLGIAAMGFGAAYNIASADPSIATGVMVSSGIIGVGSIASMIGHKRPHYNKSKNEIFLRRGDRYETLQAFAHEYTHHTQQLLNQAFLGYAEEMDDDTFKAAHARFRRIKEGQAFSAQKIIAEIYAEEEKDIGHIRCIDKVRKESMLTSWWMLKKEYGGRSKSIEEMSSLANRLRMDPMHCEGYTYFDINGLIPASIYEEFSGLIGASKKPYKPDR